VGLREATARSASAHHLRQPLGCFLGIVTGREHPLGTGKRTKAAAVNETPGQFLRFLFSFGHAHVLQVTEILGARLVTLLGRDIGMKVRHFDRRFNAGTQGDVRVAMLSAPDHSFRAD
jgi:hypothetical protein